MTRKRFTKLLMSKGYTRNDINFHAAFVRSSGSSYKVSYEKIKAGSPVLTLEGLSNALQMLSETAEVLAVFMGKMVYAFAAGMDAFSKAFSESMNE